jgi:PAS domain-containing protein
VTDLLSIFDSIHQKIVDDHQYFFGTLRQVKETEHKSMLVMERETVGHLVVPAVILDPVGMICGFNQAAQRFFGYQLVEVVGKNVKMLMTSADAAVHDEHLARYAATGQTKIIGVGRKVIGSLYPHS